MNAITDNEIIFWFTLEELCSTKLPIHIKNALNLLGYCDATTVKTIDDHELDNIEGLIRSDLHDFIRQIRDDGGSINENDFFGDRQEPHEFVFSSEERQQILRISLFINEAVNGATLVAYPNIGPVFTNELPSTDQDNNKCSTNDEIRSSLYKKIIDSYHLVGIDRLERVTEEMVYVKFENSDITGFWRCILCAEMKNKKNLREYVMQHKRKSQKLFYWINSNFLEHMRDVHSKIQKNPGHSDESKAHIKSMEPFADNMHQGIITDEVMVDVVELHENDGKSDHEYEHKKSLESYSDSVGEVLELVEYNQKHDGINDSNSPIEFIMESDIDETITHSNIYDQVSAQILRIDLSATADHKDTELEEMRFECGYISGTIKVLPMPGDGNCMFYSIAHQICAKYSEIQELAAQIRQNVVTDITSNYSEYEMALKGRVFEDHPERTQTTTEEARKILHSLSQDRFFGGSETIIAVSKLFKCNILIINESGDWYFTPRFSTLNQKTIILAYRKMNEKTFNHYDSVIQIDQCVLFDLTHNIAQKYYS